MRPSSQFVILTGVFRKRSLRGKIRASENEMSCLVEMHHHIWYHTFIKNFISIFGHQKPSGIHVWSQKLKVFTPMTHHNRYKTLVSSKTECSSKVTKFTPNIFQWSTRLEWRHSHIFTFYKITIQYCFIITEQSLILLELKRSNVYFTVFRVFSDISYKHWLM